LTNTHLSNVKHQSIIKQIIKRKHPTKKILFPNFDFQKHQHHQKPMGTTFLFEQGIEKKTHPPVLPCHTQRKPTMADGEAASP